MSKLEDLIEASRDYVMTDAERNLAITRKDFDRAAQEFKARKKGVMPIIHIPGLPFRVHGKRFKG